MGSLPRRALALRTIAAGLFLLAALGLIGATLLREQTASLSPAVRSRMILASVIAGLVIITAVGVAGRGRSKPI